MTAEKAPPDATLENLIDNLLWDFQSYINDSRVEMEGALDKSRQSLREYLSERTLRRSIACAACGFPNTTPEPQ